MRCKSPASGGGLRTATAAWLPPAKCAQAPHQQRPWHPAHLSCQELDVSGDVCQAAGQVPVLAALLLALPAGALARPRCRLLVRQRRRRIARRVIVAAARQQRLRQRAAALPRLGEELGRCAAGGGGGGGRGCLLLPLRRAGGIACSQAAAWRRRRRLRRPGGGHVRWAAVDRGLLGGARPKRVEIGLPRVIKKQAARLGRYRGQERGALPLDCRSTGGDLLQRLGQRVHWQ